MKYEYYCKVCGFFTMSYKEMVKHLAGTLDKKVENCRLEILIARPIREKKA